MTGFDDMVCERCHLPLNAFRPFDNLNAVQWRHPAGLVDHKPEPIRRTKAPAVRQVCDFCSAPDPEWTYHTRAPVAHTQAEPTYTGRHRHRRISRRWAVRTAEQGEPVDVRRDEFSTGWTACTACAELIELRDMQRLITRLRRLHPATFAAHPRGVLRDRFTPFFRTITSRTRNTDTDT